MSTSVLLLAYRLELEGTYKSFFNDLLKTEPPDWHLSILVFNFEYSYSNRGITIQKINDKPTEITYMDYTEVTKKQLDHYVNIVLPGNGWTKENYDLSSRNCQHFVHVLLEFLEIDEPIPTYYLNSENQFVSCYKNIHEKNYTTTGKSIAKDMAHLMPEVSLISPIIKSRILKSSDSHFDCNVALQNISPQVHNFIDDRPVCKHNQILFSTINHSPIWQPQPQNTRVVQSPTIWYRDFPQSNHIRSQEFPRAWQFQPTDYQRSYQTHSPGYEPSCSMIRSDFRVSVRQQKNIDPETIYWSTLPRRRYGTIRGWHVNQNGKHWSG